MLDPGPANSTSALGIAVQDDLLFRYEQLPVSKDRARLPGVLGRDEVWVRAPGAVGGHLQHLRSERGEHSLLDRYAGVADHEQGLASGLVNTSLQIGAVIVLAVVTAILGNTAAPVHRRVLAGTHTAIDVIMGARASSCCNRFCTPT